MSDNTPDITLTPVQAMTIAKAAIALDRLDVELAQYVDRGNRLAARETRKSRDAAAAILADQIAAATKGGGR